MATVFKKLERELSPDERQDSLKMAYKAIEEKEDALQRLDTLRGETKRLNNRLSAVQEDIDTFTKEAHTGIGIRPVECIERRNGPVIELIRKDTQEVLETWEAPQFELPGIDEPRNAPKESQEEELPDNIGDTVCGLLDFEGKTAATIAVELEAHLQGYCLGPDQVQMVLKALEKDGCAIKEKRGKRSYWKLTPLGTPK